MPQNDTLHPDVDAAVKEMETGEETITDEQQLKSLTNVLIKKREEAVIYRKTEGIEEIWTLCDEQYVGIDDANRAEYKELKWIKPTTMNAPVTTGATPRGVEDPRSTVFVMLTGRYVDIGSAKVAEILLPIDDKAFSFTATPVPDLIKGSTNTSQAVHNGVPLERNARPDEVGVMGTSGQTAGEAATASGPGAPTPGVPLTVKDLAEEAIELANDAARKAETRIYDWMVECQYHKEMRKVIFDAAKIGVGVLKGPYPDVKRAMATEKDATSGRVKLKVEQKLVPCVKRVDPWNIFPDPACGEDIRKGDYIWERDFFSPRQVLRLKDLPGYIPEQITKVMEQGPGKKSVEGRNPTYNENKSKHQFEIWYFTGQIKRSDLELLNPKAAADVDKEQEYVHALVTMVNDEIVHATLNPLSTGDLNYHSMPWRRRSDYWAGIGIPEQVRTPQRIVNASTRAMMNNAGISSGGQIIIDQGSVKPADGRWIITPNKIWYKSADGTIDDVRKAFTLFEIPTKVNELMEIVNYGFRLAEESTNIPLISQGMSGPTTPETLGATQLQNNNANQLLRSIGYGFDDHITEPVVTMYYEWLLLDPDVPDDEKGDFNINAHGSIAMVERAIQDQFLGQMTPFAENPVFGIDPKKWVKLLMKSHHLDHALVSYTPEEQAKLDAQPKAPPPAVQVAQIKAQTDQQRLQAQAQEQQSQEALERELAQIDAQTQIQVEKIRSEVQRLRSKMDTDRDTIYVQAQGEKVKGEIAARIQELQVKRELAVMDYANKHQMTVENVKAKLADTAMKLKVQKELASMDSALDLHKHGRQLAHEKQLATMKPPVQAPGKAKPGKGFQQI